ncbi:hypothetical protein CYY_001251 [Polysphondylium violaceum]|uniref:Uncharacterized protein n=1 Tax=Polysphondylium violaceum TaxID=133409 RepID=A0A8J4PYJ0_9MYCE|nr:hypothetical protein CYY_001251 [Polysphondylium violaceum]
MSDTKTNTKKPTTTTTTKDNKASAASVIKENNKSNNNNKKTTTTTTTTGNNTNTNTNKDGKQYPADKIVDAHQKKIDDYREEINTLKAKLDKLKGEFQAKRDEKEGIKKSLDAVFEGIKSKNAGTKKEEVKKQRQILKDLQNAQTPRKAALLDFEKEFTFKINKQPMDKIILEIENTNKALEKQIEDEQSILNQRNLLKKQSQNNAQKRKVEEYFEKRETYEQFEIQIVNQKRVVETLSAEIKENEVPREETDNTVNQLKAQRKTIEDSIAAMDADFKQAKEKIAEINKLIDEEKEKKAAYIKERNEKRVEERKAKDEERKKRDAERVEKKKLDEEKRRQEELSKVAYEEEMNNCDSLSSYLEAIKPKETKQEAPRELINKDLEGFEVLKKEPIGKAREKKKAVAAPKPLPDVIRHSLEIFSNFEKLSMAPPTKYADIEESLNQIKAKKEHYKKISAQIMEERAKAKAAEPVVEATTEAKEESSTVASDSSESTPSAVTPDTKDHTNVEVEAQ